MESFASSLVRIIRGLGPRTRGPGPRVRGTGAGRGAWGPELGRANYSEPMFPNPFLTSLRFDLDVPDVSGGRCFLMFLNWMFLMFPIGPDPVSVLSTFPTYINETRWIQNSPLGQSIRSRPYPEPNC